MIAHVHWWLAAVSFGLGMVLTFTLTARPARTQMPAWVLAEPRQRPKPEPVMKAPAAEAPTKKLPASRANPKPGPAQKKAVSKAPPRKRRPVSGDAVTERIPVAKDPATERIPVARKRPVKKTAAARKARPKGATPRRRPVPKDALTEKIPASSEAETIVLPLMPYAPYGAGSMRANLDGSGPDGWTIKGRMDSRLFYSPDDEGYEDTEAQVWFQDEEFAARAFFTPWRNSTRKT
ncbi:hypothetical protein [Mycobacterium gordonae]|uniref:Membrane protein ArfC n=1 Tax=Mycobacterium gordonae TaxID=1778 RepID=A0A1X1WBS2_MYCGO|nr:hypothetical protein [Mycobacterium gordonae]ORV83942.1 hypothetical protein AWC08_26655 [Mycobacterium gordonae]